MTTNNGLFGAVVSRSGKVWSVVFYRGAERIGSASHRRFPKAFDGALDAAAERASGSLEDLFSVALDVIERNLRNIA